MNRADARKLWPIVKAFGEGREIEFRPSYPAKAQWSLRGAHCGFTADADRYRIRVREFWLNPTDGTFIESGKGSKYWGEEEPIFMVREVLSE